LPRTWPTHTNDRGQLSQRIRDGSRELITQIVAFQTQLSQREASVVAVVLMRQLSSQQLQQWSQIIST